MQPSSSHIEPGRITIDTKAKTAEMEVIWQGRIINVKVQYDQQDIPLTRLRKDLEARLQDMLKSETDSQSIKGRREEAAAQSKRKNVLAYRGEISLRSAYKELKGKEVGTYLIRESRTKKGVKDICYVNSNGVPDRISIMRVNETIRILYPHELIDKKYSSYEALFADPPLAKILKKPSSQLESLFFSSPIRITLGTTRIIAKEELEKQYQAIKQKLADNKSVNVEFDDTKMTVTFMHHEKEIDCILAHENLREVLGGTLTIATAEGKGRRVIGDNPTRFGEGLFIALPKSRESFLEQKKGLLEAAEIFFITHDPEPVIVDDTLTPGTFLPSVLQKYPGICIGEWTHADVAPKQYLIENMHEFKKQGITTLFMEHVFYDSTQKWLDDYFNSPEGTPMPPYLELYLDRLSFDQMSYVPPDYNYKEIVRAAKEAGIRIVAIDTTVSYLSGTHYKKGTIDQVERYKAMNFVASKIIREEGKGGKFIALMGINHVSKKMGVPGVSELVGCPSLVVTRGDEKSPALSLNRKNLVDGIDISALLEIPIE